VRRHRSQGRAPLAPHRVPQRPGRVGRRGLVRAIGAPGAARPPRRCPLHAADRVRSRTPASSPVPRPWSKKEAVAEATGNDLPARGALALTGWQGREAEASRLIETIGDDVMTRARERDSTLFSTHRRCSTMASAATGRR